MSTEERRRPIKQFEVLIAFGPYRVGDKLQPTGMYRDVLLRRGVIKEVKDEPVPVTAVARDAAVDANRMVKPGELMKRRQR